MAALTLSWRRADDGAVHYRLNGRDMGKGDRGFDAVLAAVRGDPATSLAIVPDHLPLGGQDLSASTPFAPRFDELRAALGGRMLDWRTGLTP